MPYVRYTHQGEPQALDKSNHPLPHAPVSDLLGISWENDTFMQIGTALNSWSSSQSECVILPCNLSVHSPISNCPTLLKCPNQICCPSIWLLFYTENRYGHTGTFSSYCYQIHKSTNLSYFFLLISYHISSSYKSHITILY